MRKTNIRIIARRAIVMALLLGTTGCVYSYYEVHVKNGQTTMDRILSCDKENGVLDVVRLDAKRTIFYPEDFEYVHRYSDGDNWHLWKEALCRLPTVLIEVPFYFLNRRGEDVPISSEMLGIADASVVNNLLCCYSRTNLGVSEPMWLRCVWNGAMHVQWIKRGTHFPR